MMQPCGEHAGKLHKYIPACDHVDLAHVTLEVMAGSTTCRHTSLSSMLICLNGSKLYQCCGFADETMAGAEGAAWAQLPMHSLQHVPLDSLTTGISKLGQCSCHLSIPVSVLLLTVDLVSIRTNADVCCHAGKRKLETAWSRSTSDQLAAFEHRLPSLLASWSIEKERQQWSQVSKHLQQSAVQLL